MAKGKRKQAQKRAQNQVVNQQPNSPSPSAPPAGARRDNFNWEPRELQDGLEVLTPEHETFVQEWTQKLSQAVGGGLYTSHIEKNLRTVTYQAETLSDQTRLSNYINYLNWHPNVKKNNELWKENVKCEFSAHYQIS
jgi:hypothetical protein